MSRVGGHDQRWYVLCICCLLTIYLILGASGLGGVDNFPNIEPWYGVGFYLGVKMSHLENLKGLPSGQMSRIMRGWLGEDRHMFDYLMEPCWKTLVKAIAHPAGGNNVSLAEELALSHLTPADARFIGTFFGVEQINLNMGTWIMRPYCPSYKHVHCKGYTVVPNMPAHCLVPGKYGLLASLSTT